GSGGRRMRLLLLACLGFALAHEEARAATLQVVGRYALPTTVAARLVDIRWAGEDAVYLADAQSGVTAVRLREGLPEIRRVAPRTSELGLPTIQRLAISDKWIVVGHEGKLAWKKIDDATWREKLVLGFFNDFDIDGDELVILGWPSGKQYREAIYAGGG